MNIKELVALILFIALILFSVGGVAWAFIAQHLQAKAYLKWLQHIYEIDNNTKLM